MPDSAYNPTTVEYVASFDIVSVDPYVTNIDDVITENPDIIVLGYKDIIGITSDDPDYPNVTIHNDWFYLDIYGSRIQTDTYGWWLLNITNTDYQQHYIDWLLDRIENASYTGVFADDSWGSLNKDWFAWNWTEAEIPNNPNWQSDMISFFEHIKTDVSGENILHINGGIENYIPYVDGFWKENFISWSGETELEQIDYISSWASYGKTLIAFCHNGFSDTTVNFKFAYACYLLGHNRSDTAFQWRDGWSNPSFGYNVLMDQSKSLGLPSGYYSHVGNNVYRRNFVNGTAIVNFDNTPRTVALGGTYMTFSGSATYTIYTLNPDEGVVLYVYPTSPTPTPTATPFDYSPSVSSVGKEVVASGSDFNIYVVNGSIAFQHLMQNYTFTIEVLNGIWNGTDGTLGITTRYGTLTGVSQDLAYIQISCNYPTQLKLIHDGVSLSQLGLNSWNGTIADGASYYLHWSTILILPHEENFALYIVIVGIVIMFAGIMISVWMFRKHGIMDAWDHDALALSIPGIIIGFGLIVTGLMM